MKTLRQIGSLAFVLGLFTAVFAGIPWYVIVSDDPVLPAWLRIAIFSPTGDDSLFLTGPAAPGTSPQQTNPPQLKITNASKTTKDRISDSYDKNLL